MSARNGKIAKLPNEIREALNVRLFDGEPANRLADWLNSQPAVMAVLEAGFEGRPISEQNISEWRQGGYIEWFTLTEPADDADDVKSAECVKSAESAEGVKSGEGAESVEGMGEMGGAGAGASEAAACAARARVAGKMTAEQLLAVLAVRHSEMIDTIDMAHEEFYARRLAALERLTRSAVAMRKCELQVARLQIERERVELLREKQPGHSGPRREASLSSAEREREHAGRNASAVADHSQNAEDSSPVSELPEDAATSPQNLEAPESDSPVILPAYGSGEAAPRIIGRRETVELSGEPVDPAANSR